MNRTVFLITEINKFSLNIIELNSTTELKEQLRIKLEEI